MGSRLGNTLTSGIVAGAIVLALIVPASAAPAATTRVPVAPVPATNRSNDVQIARAGNFVVADFPAGFAQKPASSSSSADNIKLAKGVPGCSPYITLEKLTGLQPQSTSHDFKDDSRTVSNEVDVFKTERAASDALALFAKPIMVSCLQQLFKKQLAQDPKSKGKIASVSITLDRQDIAGLGDDSVVYEGNMVITGTDGSTAQLGVGNAAVQVGRAVDDVTYLTTNADLTEILTPAIDASVTRLRAALGGTAIPT